METYTLGWAISAPLIPIMMPYGIVYSIKLDKWKNDYEEFEFARRLTKSECFDKLNVHDQQAVVEIARKHVDGHLKWKKVLNPPNRLYLGFYYAAKMNHMI